MEEGFVKGQADNLPRVDPFMVTEFLNNNANYASAEIRGVKQARMECEADWNRLPTVCVGGVLEQLACRDALRASSVCRSWRSALGLYSAQRESLKLIASEEYYEKNTLLAQIFRKRLRSLTVVLQCSGSELEKFVHFILMRFCEAKALESVEFIGTPQYFRFEEQSTIETLRNAITAPLLHSQRHSVRRVVLHGCGRLLPIALQDPEEPLTYCRLRCLAATNIRRRSLSVHPFMFSSLQCVAMDYSSMDEIAMKGLSSLPYLRYLTLNVYKVKRLKSAPFRWSELRTFYDLQVEVTLNVINITSSELTLLKHYALTADLPLAAFRMFFCDFLDADLVQLIADNYTSTLRVFHYVDRPVQRASYDDVLAAGRDIEHDYFMEMPGNFINPFVMMCWQCKSLESLVLHGYWLEAYDLVGMARLRRASLRRLEVSALLWNGDSLAYDDADEQRLFQLDPVLADQPLLECWPSVMAEMNSILSFDWKPLTYDEMHIALTAESTKEHRYDYVLAETAADVTHPLPDVT